MTAITLTEYAKGLNPGSPEKAVVEVFAKSSDIMGALPFVGFNGAAYEYYRQAAMPSYSSAFRGINEQPTSGSGRLEPYQESSFPIDHHADVDDAILRRHGMERRGVEEALSIARVGRDWANAFIYGDNTTEPREFNGIKKRVALYGAAGVANTRTLHNSSGNGGAALSLANVDQAIAMVRRPTHIIAPRRSIPLWTAAARNSSLTGFVINTWDGIGKPKMTYAGMPILFGYEREPEGDLMDFDEVAFGGGSAVTASLYIASFGEEGLHGIQLKTLSAEDRGKLEDGVTYRTHVSWDVGLVDEHPYCLARLTSWTNAAIVA